MSAKKGIPGAPLFCGFAQTAQPSQKSLQVAFATRLALTGSQKQTSSMALTMGATGWGMISRLMN